jgi:predicted membrane protein
MRKVVGALLVLLGVFLLLASTGVVKELISQHASTLYKLYPLAISLIGLAILTNGVLRGVFVISALIIAVISIAAYTYTIVDISTIKVSDSSIEFGTGDVFISWMEREGAMVVSSNSTEINFGAGSVTIELPPHAVNVSVKGGVGEVIIIVPENVKVDFRGNVGIGEIEGLEKVREGEITARVICQLGIGKIEFVKK